MLKFSLYIKSSTKTAAPQFVNRANILARFVYSIITKSNAVEFREVEALPLGICVAYSLPLSRISQS